MDELDRRLLELLRRDGRMPIAELGRRVGLSRTATLARVRRLEESGAILGYHAEVRASGGDAHCARVGVTTRTADVSRYVRRLEALPEITEIETVTGDFDLLVRVDASSGKRLDEILDEIGSWPQTVRTTTWVVLHRYR